METTNTPEKAPTPQSDYQNIVDFLAASKTALINAALPNIAPKLAGIGYTAAEITQKLQDIETIETLNENQKKEYGEQYKATEILNKTVATLTATYMSHLTYARVVFKKDVGAQTALGLNGDRKRTFSGLKAQALLLYNGVLKNADYKAALATRGITEAQLLAQQAGFNSLDDLKADQKQETGEAQTATKLRDAAYDAFEDWMSDFKTLAIEALSDSPQLREQLGWKE